MPPEKRRGRSHRRRPSKTTARQNSRSEHSQRPFTSPDSARKLGFYCDGCQHEADATPGGRGWNIGSLSARCPGGAECLGRVAAQFRCKPYQLIEDPRPHLAGAIERVEADRIDALPSFATIDGWASALFARPDQLAWLTDRRGLSLRTIERLRIGWDIDRNAYTIPIFNMRGRRVNLVRRRPKGKAHSLAGRGKTNGGVQLYPQLVPRGPWLLLCGGLLDAPLARQHGLPAITGTHGVGTWCDHWDRYFVGRDVAIAFDVGEEHAAETRARALRDAGALRVRVVRLADAGMEKGEDITDWFVRYGRTAAQLRALIRRFRSVP